MAGQIIAGIAADLFSSGLGSLINAGTNALNQKVEYDFNKKLQSASFAHDREMLQAQVAATRQLQQDMIKIKEDTLMLAGFSPSDAARGSVNAPMTKVLDWNGTRYWAPGAMRTSSYSGRFSSQVPQTTFYKEPPKIPSSQAKPNPRPDPKPPATQQPQSAPAPSGSSSGSGSVSSHSTQSTSLSTVRSPSSTLSRTASWVLSQNLEPFMPGSLNISGVTPPSDTFSSRSSVSFRSSLPGTVSTVPKEILDSWTPAFNTRRQPLFAHLRRRGESQV
uniref:VP2 small basic protein n=1 Tax=Norovirus swine/GII/OH-QW101/03/US TaxID=316619 RepID=Q2VTJ9_NORV|nr:VP2 small basic protein [Norovirus swine/GII/OH-QW101/03/US]